MASDRLPVNYHSVNRLISINYSFRHALRALNYAYHSSEWEDFADVVKGNREAKELLEEVLWAAGSGKENEARKAFGIGMVAGLLLAASTGITRMVPQLAELKATLEASEREAQAYMAAAAKTGATPAAPEVACTTLTLAEATKGSPKLLAGLGYACFEGVTEMPEKKDVKRIRVALGPEHKAELEHLMKVWGLDRNAAAGRAISEYARKIKLEEQLEADKGKGDGERPRED